LEALVLGYFTRLSVLFLGILVFETCYEVGNFHDKSTDAVPRLSTLLIRRLGMRWMHEYDEQCYVMFYLLPLADRPTSVDLSPADECGGILCNLRVLTLIPMFIFRGLYSSCSGIVNNAEQCWYGIADIARSNTL
jgi:hypothetical protein